MESKMLKETCDITECPICQDLYTKPMLLPCLHTFCLECLQSHCGDKRPGQQSACPVCHKYFYIPNDGVTAIPPNFFIEKLLDALKISQAPSKDVLCDICAEKGSDAKASEDEEEEKLTPGERAAWHCVECSQRLCNNCVACHRIMKVSKKHQILKLGTENSVDVMKNSPCYCEHHVEERISLYCAECKKIICMVCHAEAHSAHSCTSVEKTAEQFCQQFRNHTDKVIKHAQTCDAEKERLDKVESDFVAELRKVEKKITENIHSRRQQVEQNKVLMESFKSLSVKLSESGTPADICRMADSLQARAAYLDNIHLSSGCNTMKVSSAPTDVLGALATGKDVVVTISQPPTESGKATAQGQAPTETEFIGDEASLVTDPTMVAQLAVDGGQLTGLTLLGDSLFVTQAGAEHVTEYDSTSLTLVRTIKLPFATTATDIVSCSVNECLYIACSPRVVKVLLSNKYVTKFSTNIAYVRLSVSLPNADLVVLSSNQIGVFTTYGQTVRLVTLMHTLISPQHAVLLNDKFYVLHGSIPIVTSPNTYAEHYSDEYECFVENKCYIEERPKQSQLTYDQGVSMVDEAGNLVKSYGRSQGNTTGQFNSPLHMTTYKGLLLVADYGNNKIQLLKQDLTYVKDLINADNSFIFSPVRLCCDEKTGRLYTGLQHTKCVLQVYRIA